MIRRAKAYILARFTHAVAYLLYHAARRLL